MIHNLNILLKISGIDFEIMHLNINSLRIPILAKIWYGKCCNFLTDVRKMGGGSLLAQLSGLQVL